MDNPTGIYVTLKARAILAAIDAGLVKRTLRGYKLNKFNRFWELFEKAMSEEFEYALEQKCQTRAEQNHKDIAEEPPPG